MNERYKKIAELIVRECYLDIGEIDVEQKSALEVLQAYETLLKTVQAARSCGVSEEKMTRKLVAMIIWNMDETLDKDRFDKQHEFNINYFGRIESAAKL